MKLYRWVCYLELDYAEPKCFHAVALCIIAMAPNTSLPSDC